MRISWMSDADTFSAFIKNIFPPLKAIIYYDRLRCLPKKKKRKKEKKRKICALNPKETSPARYWHCIYMK